MYGPMCQESALVADNLKITPKWDLDVIRFHVSAFLLFFCWPLLLQMASAWKLPAREPQGTQMQAKLVYFFHRHILQQWFLTGVNFALPKGFLAISEKVFCCPNWGLLLESIRNADIHPRTHRADNHLDQKVNRADIEKSALEHLSWKCWWRSFRGILIGPVLVMCPSLNQLKWP